jgi:hypothetical protein
MTANSFSDPHSAPSLEYKMYLFTTGKVTLNTVLSPSLNILPTRGLRLAVAFDDEEPQVLTAVPQDYNASNGNRSWETSVKDAARTVRSTHTIGTPGYHTLKLFMVDPGVVVQRLILDTGGMKPSYLGPPESFHRP